MTPIDLFKLIPKYDVDKGGEVYTHYIQLYQDLINDLIAPGRQCQKRINQGIVIVC